jgi:hypothetical protein
VLVDLFAIGWLRPIAAASFPGGTGPGERWVKRVYGSREEILPGHERKVACGAGSGEDRQAVG